MWSTVLLQVAPVPTMNPPVTVEGVLLGILSVLGYVTLPKLLGALTKFVDSWVENRQQVRRVETSALEKQIEQNENLFEEVKRRDELLAKLSETNVETQRLSNEQRAQFSEERKTWESKMAQLIEQLTTKDVAIEALGKENLKLQTRNRELEEENARLKARLKKYETGELDPSKVPDTPPPSPPKPTVWNATDTPDLSNRPEGKSEGEP